MKKFIIVDNHLSFRQKIKFIIENEGFGKVIGEAENGTEYLNLLKKHEPDFIIMDAVKTSMNETDVSKIAIMNVSDLQVLQLILPDEDSNHPNNEDSNLVEFTDKSAKKREFETAFRTILNGKKSFSNSLSL